MSDLHDVSTPSGATAQFLHRWKNTIWGLLIGTTALLAIGLLVFQYLNSSDEIPESTFVVSGSTLMYHGNQTKFDERYFDPFPGLPNLSTPIDTLEIKWTRIHAPNLTAHLSAFYPSLSTLLLDNVTLEGSFPPAPLPSLKHFFLNQGLQPEERNLTKYSLALISQDPSWILSTLFFLNSSTPTDFPSKAATAYNNGVNVTVYLKGSVAYKLDPQANQVRLDISQCSPLLDKLPRNFTSVTLGRCNDLKPNSLPPSVTVLNLYIVYVTSPLLSSILTSLPNLQEFVAEVPDNDVEVNLGDFGPNVSVISVSSMRISLPSPQLSLPTLKEFYFGATNQYSWLPSRTTALNATFFTHFPSLFPNVQRVGLFDLTDPRRYEILSSVLNTPSVRWLLAQNFPRIANTNESSSDVVAPVEAELTRLGLAEETEDFVLVTSEGGGRVAMTLTHEEKLWLRYKYLGWRPIDSWPKYLYVQKIIEAGGLL